MGDFFEHCQEIPELDGMTAYICRRFIPTTAFLIVRCHADNLICNRAKGAQIGNEKVGVL